ncbi:MAG: peptide chain release factor N(5)-glutamine methyltransferase [Cyanophyceae cyanobacterium]
MSLTIPGRELAVWRHQAIREAVAAAVSPQEVDWFLQEVTELDRLSLRLESFRERTVTLKRPLTVLTEQWQHRLQERIPLQYLVGTAPWRDFKLQVSPAVLIPRPETEQLIDLAKSAVEQSPLAAGPWVDLGTGSGAIALGLAAAFPHATVHAVDCSQAALTIAQENAARLGLEHRIRFYLGSWWSPLEELKGQVCGLVANPPYIPTALIAELQPEVAHEPQLALDGGQDGLSHIRHLVHSAPHYLVPGGIWLVEMMAGQGEAVRHLLAQQGSYSQIQIIPDLAGLDRYALAQVSNPVTSVDDSSLAASDFVNQSSQKTYS